MKDLMIKSKVKLICEKYDLIYNNLALKKYTHEVAFQLYSETGSLKL